LTWVGIGRVGDQLAPRRRLALRVVVDAGFIVRVAGAVLLVFLQRVAGLVGAPVLVPAAVVLVELLANRPRRYRAGEPYEAASTGNDDTAHRFDGSSVDLDVIRRMHVGAVIDARAGVVVERADVDRTAHADEAAGDRKRE